jgi:hypothetical protein
MPLRLNQAAVQRWLRDQQAALQQVKEERVRFLLNLNSEDALCLYLAISLSRSGRGTDAEPSLLLWSMRQTLSTSRKEDR